MDNAANQSAVKQDAAAIQQLVADKKEKIIAVSQQVWENPELLFQERKSAGFIIEALKSEGFSVEEGVAGMPTAFVGCWGQRKPVIGIIGEYDALPGLSQKAGVPYKEPLQAGAPGHGCGHNLLGAGALGGAIAAKDYMEKEGLSGTVRYFGCPAEEGGAGKVFMARDGLFDDVDAVLSWHPDQSNTVLGTSTLAIMSGTFTFIGKASHAAASPHLGRSALDACELMNIGVNYLREHVIQEARIHYAYQDAGGPAANVVQERATLKYIVRAPHLKQVREITARVKEIAQGAAIMTQTRMEGDFDLGMSEYVPNHTVSYLMSDALRDLGGPAFDDADRALAQKYFEGYDATTIDTILQRYASYYPDPERFRHTPLIDEVAPYKETDRLLPASTDMGDVSLAAPTAWLSVACYASGTPGHSWQEVSQANSSISHKAIQKVAEVFALTVVRALQQPELLQKAREEQNKRMGKYESPLGKDQKPNLPD